MSTSSSTATTDDALLLPASGCSSLAKQILALSLSLLIGIVLLTQSTGTLNSFGTISIYYASYYHKFDPESPVVQNCFFAVFPATCIIEGLAFGTVHAAGTVCLYQAIGFRATQAINGLFFAMAFMVILWVTNPVYFMILYSLGVGVGSGAAVYICSLEAWKHFSIKSKGKVLGIITASYGLGPAIFNPLFALLCNPNNEMPTIEVSEGQTRYMLFDGDVAESVPHVSAQLGVVFAFCFFITAVGFPSVNKETDPDTTLPRDVIEKPQSPYPNLRSALSSWIFWSLALNMFCSMTYGLFVINSYKNYGMTRYQNDQLLSSVGGFAAGVSTISKAVFSIAMDHLSFRAVFGFNMLMQLFVSATITLVLDINIWYYSAWITVSFLAVSGIFPAFIMETSKVFGSS